MRYDIEKGFYDRVVKFIKSIPAGKVATYGQIADYAGNRRAAREVAYILHSSSEKEGLPWQRVINSKGMISLPKGSASADSQKALLDMEGVEFDERERVDFEQYAWDGPPDDWLEEHDLMPPRSLKKKKKGKQDSDQLSLF